MCRHERVCECIFPISLAPSLRFRLESLEFVGWLNARIKKTNTKWGTFRFLLDFVNARSMKRWSKYAYLFLTVCRQPGAFCILRLLWIEWSLFFWSHSHSKIAMPFHFPSHLKLCYWAYMHFYLFLFSFDHTHCIVSFFHNLEFPVRPHRTRLKENNH